MRTIQCIMWRRYETMHIERKKSILWHFAMRLNFIVAKKNRKLKQLLKDFPVLKNFTDMNCKLSMASCDRIHKAAVMRENKKFFVYRFCLNSYCHVFPDKQWNFVDDKINSVGSIRSKHGKKMATLRWILINRYFTL